MAVTDWLAPHLESLGLIWINFGLFGIHLGLFVVIHSHLNSFRLIWTFLTPTALLLMMRRH